MQMPTMLQGESLKRLAQGVFFGGILTMVVGFGWGGWVTGGTASKNAARSASEAVVTALAPICVDKFAHASDATAKLVALKATESYKRDTYLADGGWATFPGNKEPNRDVAEACAKLLTTPPAKSAQN